MTTEQKEAIEKLAKLVELRKSKNTIKYDNCICSTSDLDIVLNLIQEQEKEIEKYKKLYQKALDNTVKTDKENIDLKKQIDLMAEEIRNTILIVKPESKFCQYEEDCKNIRCKDCIKQFFEKQAKEKEE